MNKQPIKAHLLAIFTIVIWGTTFISTKVLLSDWSPLEILCIRFLLGYLVLWLLYPKMWKHTNRSHEKYFAFAGLCGICLYFLLENVALTYTTASNVGVIISIAPFFTVLFSRLCKWETTMQPTMFFLGFLFAMIGIALLSFQKESLSLHPFGDLLACIAAIVWACYALLTKKISSFGYPIIAMTRHIFFYGLLFMLPMMACFDIQFNITNFLQPTTLFNFIFLGVGASAICFVTWNYAVKELGASQTSVYIYLVPIITVVSSWFILNEQMTSQSLLGVAFTLIGLCISQYQKKS